MPFEPLKTDEPNEGHSPATPEFEKQLMSGCTVILTGCFVVYFLVIWPWIVFLDTHTMAGLTKSLTFGLIPATLLGILLLIKFNIAGASGFVGGIFASAVFVFLRLQQFMLAEGHNDLPQPEYPSSWVIFIPIAMVFLAVGLSAIFWPKDINQHQAQSKNDQE